MVTASRSLHLQELFVVLENLATANLPLGVALAMLGKIAGGGLDNIVGRGTRLLGADMCHALAAGADITDDEPIIGPGDVGGRRLVLPVNGNPENIGAGDSGGGHG